MHQLISKTENEVIRMRSQGLSVKEIADERCNAEGTIQRHINNIYAKLNLRNSIDLHNYFLLQEFGIDIQELINKKKT